ncbi:MAG: hypothetical protein JXR68_05650 [Bacteroidales bacterium]|nr:hypothetical protein [Bacteroidales bacterium]
MKTRLLLLTLVAFLSLSVFNSCKDPVEPNPNATEFIDNGDGSVTIIDKGEGVGTKTLSADTVWILQGLVFVNEGQELTIEAGTLIKGMPGTGENASALIVARGGKINAVGTATAPIVFTANADNYEGTGVSVDAQGLWGGVILLGKATTNNPNVEKAIEGLPTSESRGLYGGSDDSDNSGVLKYVSIRHGGTDIGEGNEINGLTLGAVGSGTVIEYIEVISNKDDGIEFFGGCPQLKYILVSKVGDDSFDYDEGFHGKGQFWCAIQSADGDRLGEHDGGPSDNELGAPYATPIVYNATYIGNATGRIITFRDNAGGTYKNSIFVNQAKGIDIEYLQDDNAAIVGCSYKMFQDDYLNIENNAFYNVASIISDTTTNFAKSIFKISVPEDDNGNPLYEPSQNLVDAWASAFAGNTNSILNPSITATNPVPTTAVAGSMATYPATFFEQVTYKGAFGDNNWANGWTLSFK